MFTEGEHICDACDDQKANDRGDTMSVIERTCLNCNGSGKTRVLNQHGHDTGRDRPCGTCDGSGQIVPAAALRGAVAALRKYGRHGAGCALLNSLDRQPCDCGWADVARSLLGGQ